MKISVKLRLLGKRVMKKQVFFGENENLKVPWCGRRRWKEEQERKPLID